MEFVDTCRQLIAIDSTPGMGTVEVAHFLANYCRELGFVVELQEETHNGLEQTNIYIRLPQDSGSSEDELLLQSHLDTRDPGPYALWTMTQENPFNATIYGGKLIGLGVAGAKLGILCQIEAAKSLLSKPLKRSLVIAGTYGFELGMAGAVKMVRRKKVRAKQAVVSAPTSLELCNAGPGSVAVEVSFPFTAEERAYRINHDVMESTSSQSKFFHRRSSGNEADNPIDRMLDYLGQMPEGIAIMDMDGGVSPTSPPPSAVLEIDVVGTLSDTVAAKLLRVSQVLKDVEKELKNYPDDSFVPEYSTLNLGMIRAYDDHVRVWASGRLLPSVPLEVYESVISQLKQACAEQGGVFRVTDYKPPFVTEPESNIARASMQAADASALSADLAKVMAGSEASVFSKLGMECVAFGPGQAVGSESPANEEVELQGLERATSFYRKLLEDSCI